MSRDGYAYGGLVKSQPFDAPSDWNGLIMFGLVALIIVATVVVDHVRDRRRK